VEAGGPDRRPGPGGRRDVLPARSRQLRDLTIGSNLATSAGGKRCVKYGVTRDSALGLEVVLAGGTVLRTGSGARKDVAG
jgi:FAD/FMN-containing dehydrogenase